MPIINYYTVDGEIIAERSSTSGRRDYLPDALGSVQNTIADGAIENTYSYKPYGGQESKSGPGADPAFGWVGTRGYRNNSRQYAESYVRARTYSTFSKRWTSRDQMWPRQAPFAYASSNPVLKLDSSGNCPIWMALASPAACIAWDWSHKDERNSTKHGVGAGSEGFPEEVQKDPCLQHWTEGCGKGIGSNFCYTDCEKDCRQLCNPVLGWNPTKKACVGTCLRFCSECAKSGCDGFSAYCDDLENRGRLILAQLCEAFYNASGCQSGTSKE